MPQVSTFPLLYWCLYNAAVPDAGLAFINSLPGRGDFPLIKFPVPKISRNGGITFSKILGGKIGRPPNRRRDRVELVRPGARNGKEERHAGSPAGHARRKDERRNDHQNACHSYHLA
jgi:hypothetical protein